jgi:uncharacterized membrane protein
MDKKKLINCIVSGVLLLLFLIITTLVITNNISWFDDLIYNFLIGFRSNGLDFIFKTINTN